MNNNIKRYEDMVFKLSSIDGGGLYGEFWRAFNDNITGADRIYVLQRIRFQRIRWQTTVVHQQLAEDVNAAVDV